MFTNISSSEQKGGDTGSHCPHEVLFTSQVCGQQSGRGSDESREQEVSGDWETALVTIN